MISRGMPNRSQRLLLEGPRIRRLVGQQVVFQVQDGAGEIFGGGEALAEILRLLQLVHQRLRHRLAGAAVDGEPG